MFLRNRRKSSSSTSTFSNQLSSSTTTTTTTPLHPNEYLDRVDETTTSSQFLMDESAPRKWLDRFKLLPQQRDSSDMDNVPSGLLGLASDEVDDCNSIETCSITGGGGSNTSCLPATASASAATSIAAQERRRRKLCRQWRRRYQAPPLVTQSTIMMMGFVLFLMATLWPPLILLAFYLASKLIPYMFRVNDDATSRRQLFHQFAQWGNHPDNFRTHPNFPKRQIHIEESYWINQRGMALCTVTILPKDQPIKAVVCFCHGYTDNVSYSKQIEFQRLIQQGIAFVGIEYEGHGRSDGALGLITNWDLMIDDVSQYFQQTIQITQHDRYKNLPVFLMGESMGGAVAYSVYQRTPDLYRGVVFLCPMCKISDDMLPPKWVIRLLQYILGPPGSSLQSLLGYLPIAPSKNDLYDVANHLPEKAQVVWRCPTTFGRNPRLVTARELLHVTQHISDHLHEFNAPFMIVHGREDRVTDPKLSLALYQESCSDDKTLQLYDGMWHSLTTSEPDENMDRVFNDITTWMLDRCTTTTTTTTTAPSGASATTTSPDES